MYRYLLAYVAIAVMVRQGSAFLTPIRTSTPSRCSAMKMESKSGGVGEGEGVGATAAAGVGEVLRKMRSAISETTVAAKEFDAKGAFEAAKNSILKRDQGPRGEVLFAAQAFLVLFIILGGVPFLGSAIELLAGPGFIFLALVSGAAAVVGLGPNNLSPLPKPVQGNQLQTQGVYGLCRHPMYSSLILGSFGLGTITGSTTRLLLGFVLFLVLDRKATKEEGWLTELHPEYNSYKANVAKFFPFVY